MSKLIIDATPTLRAFLNARLKGASEKQLRLLQELDEASRAATVSLSSDGNVIFLPGRSKATKPRART